ncbi:MAG: hypothetical protein K0A89_02015 [ANME-2 cluster archaeon]|nr:hypothetical protein [ANME-2 cluster archaeon]
MINACEHPRDRALIASLYVNGARISEIGNLTIKHVKFDQHGVALEEWPPSSSLRRFRTRSGPHCRHRLPAAHLHLPGSHPAGRPRHPGTLPG